ncbi:unnamed protein product [Heligmosomoides polygyrus]|uniref:Transposase n=1 Tax=Heligmosomoides polygyrus TaxID=6339 RepID=A0A183GPT2_HELPZ|nr:unnamed protein product [Heligmosomoides polygyrus]
MRPYPHREAVARLAESGESTTAIAGKPSIPLRIVQRIIKQWNEKGNVSIKVKSGRPRSVNTRKNRAIIKKRIDRNDSISLKRLFSVRRVEDVLWTDEKIFTVEVAHNAQHDHLIFKPDQGHTWKRKIVTKSLFSKGLMVWAGITANKETPLLFVKRNVKINAGTYQEEVLKKDWAIADAAGTTIAYLDANFPGYLTKDQWPYNSPYLIPLDFAIRGYLEQKLRKRSITNLDQLRRELNQAWAEIDANYLRRTVKSVKPRLEDWVKPGKTQ